MPRPALLLLPLLLLLGLAGVASAADGPAHTVGPALLGVRVEFLLFGLTLLCVAVFHHHSLYVALGGLTAVLGWRLALVEGFQPLAWIGHEWLGVLNLLGLLVGFALLAKHFEESGVPQWLPKVLPDDWKGGLVLLLIVFVLSAFLDNIAAAMIGGEMARVLYKHRVHIGFLAAIVAASNAGGAGSVVGDTTTTMMWLAGASPLTVLEASIGSLAAVAFCGTLAAWQQHRFQAITKDAPEDLVIDWGRVGIVGLVLVGAIGSMLATRELLGVGLPAVGVWVALLLGWAIRHPGWSVVPGALKGAAFLLSLVLCASLMPVESLPPPSWGGTLGLGFVSAVFDNIPLTALAIRQDMYDWGMLAFAVGFGGSMMWFGSSAGVALSTIYPQARSAASWLRYGWHVIPAYVIGYMTLLAVVGWRPEPIQHSVAPRPAVEERVAEAGAR